MNFESWNVDLDSASAVHESGFKITVDGDPANPSGVNPGKFPEQLSAVEQARLLRSGLEAIQKQAAQRGRAHFQERVSPPRKPSRPILSLKKNA